MFGYLVHIAKAIWEVYVYVIRTHIVGVPVSHLLISSMLAYFCFILII